VYNIQTGNTDIEINFYMGINDEKEKSREDYVELRILYFIWVLGAPYYQGGYIGWFGEVQNIKNLPYHQKLLSDQTYPAPSRIPETLAGHVRLPDQTCPASQPYPELTNHIRLLGRIPEAFSRHVRPNPIPQRLSLRPNISGPQVDF
jgi:hypothetical protein